MTISLILIPKSDSALGDFAVVHDVDKVLSHLFNDCLIGNQQALRRTVGLDAKIAGKSGP